MTASVYRTRDTRFCDQLSFLVVLPIFFTLTLQFILSKSEAFRVYLLLSCRELLQTLIAIAGSRFGDHEILPHCLGFMLCCKHYNKGLQKNTPGVSEVFLLFY